jgi:hypothetical protein
MIQGDMGGFTAWVPVEIRCVPLYFKKYGFKNGTSLLLVFLFVTYQEFYTSSWFDPRFEKRRKQEY